jgi:hypothetical protein
MQSAPVEVLNRNQSSNKAGGDIEVEIDLVESGRAACSPESLKLAEDYLGAKSVQASIKESLPGVSEKLVSGLLGRYRDWLLRARRCASASATKEFYGEERNRGNFPGKPSALDTAYEDTLEAFRLWLKENGKCRH